MRGLSGVSGFLATWRVFALATVLAVAMAVVGASPEGASASSAAHLPSRPGGRAVPGSGLTLAQAPPRLRAAVRRTLGTPIAASGVQKAKLTATDGAANDSFGFSVALSGSTAVVGAYGKTSSTGAAYVFVRSGSTWTQQATLTAAGGAPGDSFGNSVAIAKSTAVVGEPGNNSGGAGAAQVFVNV
jgi:hypothetical protein